MQVGCECKCFMCENNFVGRMVACKVVIFVVKILILVDRNVSIAMFEGLGLSKMSIKKREKV